MFLIECSQIRIVSNDTSLLPVENVKFSSYNSTYMNASTGWCPDTSDISPSVHLTFAEQLYLLYILRFNPYVANFSITHENSSGENATYTNVDGIYVRSIQAV